ncbi:glycosyltransferase 87 family protein [Oscillochloris sp. ZM17-4]|uniref:glycosyltransferase 87 family protein n=1 Tax=Oscillochloris sp. ZM17-4 TaxID=2866714 RepID=UPI001C731518|nr:glycosyltransferase 87 family protein [Oscillochloris sp. ZM17-4]MBX0327550.1 glycosyltransferase 87 family protein [Oscillochloris sp. ZM17-4]
MAQRARTDVRCRVYYLQSAICNLQSAICNLQSAIFERWARRTSGRSGLPWMLLWLPLAQGLVLGQTTLIVLAALVFAELYYNEGRERRAGLLLALAVLKPQVAILAAAWLLLRSFRERRYQLPLTFFGISAALWLVAVIIAGPQIVPQWVAGLVVYDDLLPDRLLLFPPLGPLIGLMAVLLWWRHGRGDHFGLLILLTMLFYPLSVVYMTSAVAFVVIRWRRDWPWYPLALSWIIPLAFPLVVRTPDTIAALTQSIVATGMLAGLLPQLPWRRRPPHPTGGDVLQ